MLKKKKKESQSASTAHAEARLLLMGSDFTEVDFFFAGLGLGFHWLTFHSGEFSRLFNNVGGDVVWRKEGVRFAAALTLVGILTLALRGHLCVLCKLLCELAFLICEVRMTVPSRAAV